MLTVVSKTKNELLVSTFKPTCTRSLLKKNKCEHQVYDTWANSSDLIESSRNGHGIDLDLSLICQLHDMYYYAYISYIYIVSFKKKSLLKIHLLSELSTASHSLPLQMVFCSPVIRDTVAQLLSRNSL